MTEETKVTVVEGKKKSRKLGKSIAGKVLTITEPTTGKVSTYDFAKLPANIQANLGPYFMMNCSLRSKFLVFATIFFVFSMMLAVCGGKQEASAATPTVAKTYTLRVADPYPAAHFFHTLYLNPWMDKVTAYTNGQVKFEMYPAEQLGKTATLLTALKTKIADVASIAPVTFPGEFGLSTVEMLPGMSPSAAQSTKAFRALLKSGPVYDEYIKQGVIPLFGVCLTPFEMVTTKKVVSKFSDLKGLKISVAGGALETNARAIGVTPVTISTAEVYTALERGTVDGSLTPVSTALDYKWDEVVKHATVGASLGSAVFMFGIRMDLWNELPQNVKDAMKKAEEEVCDGAKMDAKDADAVKVLQAKGMKFNTISPEEQAKFREALKPVWASWVKTYSDKGLPAQAVLDAFKKENGIK